MWYRSGQAYKTISKALHDPRSTLGLMFVKLKMSEAYTVAETTLE